MSDAEEVKASGYRALLGNAAIYVISNVLSAAIPFVLMPVLTRRLLPADYGVTAMFATMLAVFSCLAGLSVHGAVSLRYFQREGFHLPTYVGTALALLAFTTSILLAVVSTFGSLIAGWVDVPVRWLLVAVLVASANFVGQVRLALWQAEGKATKHLAYSVASALANFCGSVVLVVFADLHYAGRLSAIAITALLFATISIVSLRRDGQLCLEFDPKAARDALRFGLPLVPHALGALVITLADRVLITRYVGIAHTGVYLVGAQLGMIVAIVSDAANRAYSPWLYARLGAMDEAMKRRIVRNTYLFFAGISAFALALSVIVPFALRWLVGPRFIGAGRFVFWLSFAGAFQGMYLMVTNYVFFAKRTELLAVVTFATGVFNIILNYALIRSRGAIGAAEATCGAYLVSFIGTWIVAARVFPMPWRAALRRTSTGPHDG
jgi:O-antigen/teichoic acid export membrane protein